MALACKYCVLTKGLKGTGENLADGKKIMFDTPEEFFNHIEMEHDIPITRVGETESECMERFKKINKRAGTDNCQCPFCLTRKTLGGWL